MLTASLSTNSRNNYCFRYDFPGFINFLYFLHLTQKIFFILTFLVIENILVLFYHYFNID